jgi:putative membrane protein
MKTLVAIAALSLLGSCSPDISQQAHPQPRSEPAPSADLASQDRDFLERAAEGGNAEISMGALVDDHALQPDVIAFGHMMVADHSAANAQLTAIAAAKHISLPTFLGEHQQNFDRIVDLTRDDFDREFKRVMIDDHQDAAQLFRSEAETGVDPALKAFAAATLPTIEAHLAQAKALSPPVEVE